MFLGSCAITDPATLDRAANAFFVLVSDFKLNPPLQWKINNATRFSQVAQVEFAGAVSFAKRKAELFDLRELTAFERMIKAGAKAIFHEMDRYFYTNVPRTGIYAVHSAPLLFERTKKVIGNWENGVSYTRSV